MTPEQTEQLLIDTTTRHAEMTSVMDWLDDKGIDNETFAAFMRDMVASMPEKASPFTMIAVGFGLGWTAHEVLLDTQVEVGPAPDLSDSLE